MNDYINLAMLTDFYELTMMQGYFFKYPNASGIFDMLYRHQPYNGGYTVFSGLEPFLSNLEKLKFSNDDLAFLNSKKIFKKEFLNFLKDFSFRGDVYSLKEGSIAFPNEPLLRVHGTLMETQLVESLVLNFINFQTLISTKASRIVDISGTIPVMEFGLRRAPGIDGSLSATRAAYIGGVSQTSNVLAGKLFDIPVSGTMAHSWVMCADTELESFENYAELYPHNCVLLVDTFDTLTSGIPNAIKTFNRLKNKKPPEMAVRIDSGDLDYLSKKARKMLDENGLEDVKIIVSSDLDEWIIKQLLDSNAPIDAFGVGTKLSTGGKEAALPGVYKIVALNKDNILKPCIKISNQPEKITNPGLKNIMRFYDEHNSMLCDLVYLEEEEDELEEAIKNKQPVKFNHPVTDYSYFLLKTYNSTKKLLSPVMKNGKKTSPSPSLPDIRKFRQKEISTLDITYRRLLNPHTYKVSLSDSLKNLKSEMIKKFMN